MFVQNRTTNDPSDFLECNATQRFFLFSMQEPISTYSENNIGIFSSQISS